MSLAAEQILLRVYLQSADRASHIPTHERIVLAARAMGMAGIIVLPGILGLGSRGLTRATAWDAADQVPVIVELIDTAEHIEHFLNGPLAMHLKSGMATLERARVILHRRHAADDKEIAHMGPALAPLSTLPHLESRDDMQVRDDGILVRIFIGESDRYDGKPLYEAIVEKVRDLGLAGATVLRGSEGYGAHSIVHKAQLLAMSADLPIVIEIVDAQDQINRLLPHLDTMVQEGMVTMEYVAILMYRHAGAEAPSVDA